jgi:hypothetical protein
MSSSKPQTHTGDTDLEHSGSAQKRLDNNLTIAKQALPMKFVHVEMILMALAFGLQLLVVSSLGWGAIPS